MKKNNLLLIGFISIFLSCNAQKTEVRNLSSFDKIKISGALSLEYTDSDSSFVSITANEADLAKVSSRIENSTLIVSTKGNLNRRSLCM